MFLQQFAVVFDYNYEDQTSFMTIGVAADYAMQSTMLISRKNLISGLTIEQVFPLMP
jgi:hypothetical protein